MKKIISIVLVFALVFSLSACGGKKGDLVKVNKTVITKQQLNDLSKVLAFTQGVELDKAPKNVKKEIKTKLLTQMIEVECLKDYYEEKGKKVITDENKKDEEKFLKQAKEDKSFKKFLKDNKISDETLNYIYESQFYSIQLKKDVDKSLKDIDDKAKKKYEKNKGEYVDIKATASHILVKDEKTANDVYDKIQKGGDFAALAKQYGTDGTKDKGGSLGTFGKGQMIPDFEKAVFSMKDGEIRKPLKTVHGWHIIKCEKLEKTQQTFEEVKDLIKNEIAAKAYEDKIKEVKKSADIKYYDEKYKEKKDKNEKK